MCQKSFPWKASAWKWKFRFVHWKIIQATCLGVRSSAAVKFWKAMVEVDLALCYSKSFEVFGKIAYPMQFHGFSSISQQSLHQLGPFLHFFGPVPIYPWWQANATWTTLELSVRPSPVRWSLRHLEFGNSWNSWMNSKWRFPKSWGYPNSWMVYFMENPIKIY